MGNWTQVRAPRGNAPLQTCAYLCGFGERGDVDGSLQITTATAQVHSGTLLLHDPMSQIVVLSSQARSVNGVDTPPSNSLVDLQIIKISSIRDIRVLGPKQENFKPYEAKPLTLQDYKVREELAMKRALEEQRRLGVGVSIEGQKIFDAFAKTYFRGQSSG